MKNIITTDDERFQYVMKLEQDILFSVLENNILKIEEILKKQDDNFVNQSFKEKMSFLHASTNFIKGVKGAEEVVKYLIFDYGISKENARNDVADKDDKIQGMFKIRELNDNLSKDLNTNNSKTDKKPKL
jgi:glycerol-3-phosphate responsive antiterminator